MKRKSFILSMLFACSIATAQISPDSCSVEHKDSCWYVTLNYEVDEIPSRDGMVLITHLCNPDTCISSTARHFQGKKYAKRYVKRHGYQPNLHSHGSNQCTIAMPEEYAGDTIWGITYCEYSHAGSSGFSLDTMNIILPDSPPLSCHKVDAALTIADHIAQEHNEVRNISYYTPLTNAEADEKRSKQIVRYRTNSSLLDVDYMKNAQSIDELMSIINNIMADSSTTVEAVQIVGYNSPETAEQASTQLGYQRAMALRDHIRRRHSLPDSIFEIADGGHNWQLIYDDIATLGIPDGDSLIALLRSEPSATRRRILLRNYDKGDIYNELSRTAFAKQRGAGINAIFYHNSPDSVAITLNSVIDELINNPKPDYHRLAQIIKQYKNDPRAINLQGVIDYRRHRLHAAEQAFIKAAEMGDEQAAVNLMIVQNEKEKNRKE